MAVVLTPTKPNPLIVIGSLVPVVVFTATTLGTTTVDIVVPGLSKVTASVVQITDSGGNVVTSDADITYSGNTITIADGSSFSLADTYVATIIAWGISSDQMNL